MEEPDFAEWIGRSRMDEDEATAYPVQALAATLDLEAPATSAGDAIPPAWHWLWFLATAPQASLGHDGAEARGEFLPPVELPRRMWAGGNFTFHQPLRLGERIRRISTIREIQRKTGRQGKLAFVTVEHEISGADGLAVSETHNIVYRAAAVPGAAATTLAAPEEDAVWRREIVPDPVLLFRFSALTFNGHRIHYDRSYCTETEGYPGLVVHGPLQAMLLLELARAQAPRPVRRFDYRAQAPIFDTGPFSVNGRPDAEGAALWTADAAGHLGMSGRVAF